MTIKLNDIIKLKSLNGFELIAGRRGTGSIVNTICIADFEFAEDPEAMPPGIRRGSLVLIGSRFASKAEDLDRILHKIAEAKVAGAAIISSEAAAIPQGLIDFCDSASLPLLVCRQGETRVDNLVFDILTTIQQNTVSFSLERELERMLGKEISRNEVEKISRQINPRFEKSVIVSYLKAKNQSADFSPARVARNYVEEKMAGVTVDLLAYLDGLFVIISMAEPEDKKVEEILAKIRGYAADPSAVVTSRGGFHDPLGELDIAFRECQYAFLVATLEDEVRVDYDDIGTYKFLIPNRHDDIEMAFMRKYLRRMNKEQLETAIVFVKSNGSFDEAARRLVCHRNTVRYRIGRIKEKTDPTKSDFEFYENLAAAIKIYLLNNL